MLVDTIEAEIPGTTHKGLPMMPHIYSDHYQEPVVVQAPQHLWVSKS